MGNAESALVETIRQVGISNYSLISRLTGLNVETVRYKVNKQLGRLGLGIEVNIDYGQIGFSTHILHVTPNPNSTKSWLDVLPYLNFVARPMGSPNYFCVYSIPYRFRKRYVDLLESLKKDALIEQYSTEDTSWIRYPHLRAESYNFSTGRWMIDWKKIDLKDHEEGIQLSLPNTDAKIDYIDAKVLHFLQEDPGVNPAQIAKAIKANQRTVRYHYSEHVVKHKFILSNNVRWFRPMLEGKLDQLMELLISFRNLDSESLARTKRVCNRIPFTWLEACSSGGSSYYALLDIPMDYFHETVKYIENRIDPKANPSTITILDPSKTRRLSFPDEMFDRERGWCLSISEHERMLNRAPFSGEEVEVSVEQEEEVETEAQEATAAPTATTSAAEELS